MDSKASISPVETVARRLFAVRRRRPWLSVQYVASTANHSACWMSVATIPQPFTQYASGAFGGVRIAKKAPLGRTIHIQIVQPCRLFISSPRSPSPPPSISIDHRSSSRWCSQNTPTFSPSAPSLPCWTPTTTVLVCHFKAKFDRSDQSF